ncbi:MAG: hypothetical protein IPH35_21150 [Rhodoferax sp.]|nr:hypothetical protein [Rhodoferax sp.]
MSLFNWFSKKTPADSLMPEADSGLSYVSDPFAQSTKGHSKTSVPTSGSAASRKSERLERREQLYGVIREAMTHAGMLSSSYKFKVLSLDSNGRQYLIMMDLSLQYSHEVSRLSEIESLIAQHAKSRHEILVSAVYWRVSDQVTAGAMARPPMSVVPPPTTPPPPAARPAPPPSPEATSPSAVPHYDPLMPEEVAAFKRALAAEQASQSRPTPGEVIRSGRRKSGGDSDFAETKIDERHVSPLSKTQFGDLF